MIDTAAHCVAFSVLQKSFAYAAVKTAGTLPAAKAALEAVNSGQYDTAKSSGGVVMTAATEAGKSFTFSFPAAFGPREIMETTFAALQIIAGAMDAGIDAAQLKTNLLARASLTARITF